MREQRNDPKRLKDILQAIDTIFLYVDNREMKEFLSYVWNAALYINYEKIAFYLYNRYFSFMF